MSGLDGLPDSGERVVPDFVDDSQWIASNLLKQHLKRYGWANSMCADKSVLDIACGSGYGAKGMADAGAKSVLGVDLDSRAVAYAKDRYRHPNVEFRSGTIHDVDETFDLITCFETLEHVSEPTEFLQALRKCLKPGGRLMISATVVPTMDIYPYHLRDYTKAEFRDACKAAGFEAERERTLTFRASPAQVRAAMFERAVMPKTGKVLNRPWQFAQNVWRACVTQGLSYENCIIEARP